MDIMNMNFKDRKPSFFNSELKKNEISQKKKNNSQIFYVYTAYFHILWLQFKAKGPTISS